MLFSRIGGQNLIAVSNHLVIVQPGFGVTCFMVHSELAIEKVTFFVKYLLISEEFLCTCKFVCAVQARPLS